MYYVLLRWSEYHELRHTSATICSSEKQAIELSDSYLDHVVQVETKEDAEELASAFHDLSIADWTPNQTPDDKDYYGQLRSRAIAILEKYGE